MSQQNRGPSARSATIAGGITALALTAALTVLGPTGACAEEGSAPADTSKPVLFLRETVVTGARYPRAYYESPQALSFLSRTQVLERLPNAPGDLLATMPGADDSKDSPWEQRPVLRGLGGQRVLVLVDGMPMNSARGNGPHPSLVDPEQIERVEVVRGPSSVAYGSDALGGAINIITREVAPGSDERLRGSAAIGGSTADDQGNGFLELMKRTGPFSAYVSTGARHALNYRSPDGDVANSGFRDYNALANLRWDFTEKTALKLGWQLYRGDDIGIPGLSFAFPGASQDFDFSFYNRDYVHLSFDHSYGSSWIAGTTAKVYWQQERRDFASDQSLAWFMMAPFGVFPSAGPPSGASDTNSVDTHQDRYLDISTVGFQTQLSSVKTRLARVTFGLDGARDMTDGDNVRFRTYRDATGAPIGGTRSRTTASIPDGDFDNYGVYAQSEWYLQPRWTLHTGGRLTHYRYRTDLFAPGPGLPTTDALSVDDDALCGSAGLVWSPARDLHVSANVSNGFREPNAQDLFFNGPASVGYVLGNVGLDPEKSISYDLGLRWGPGRFGIAVNGFYSTYDDLIDAIAIATPVGYPPGQPYYQYTNISKARIWGYEVEAEARFLSRWTARGNVSDAIGDITNREAIEKLYGVSQDRAPLGSVPPIHGAATLRWTDARNRFWVEPGARWAWRTSRLPLPTPGVPEFTEFKKEWIVGDVYAGAVVPWGQKIMVGVRNVTDTPYKPALSSVEETGINVVGQLTTSF